MSRAVVVLPLLAAVCVLSSTLVRFPGSGIVMWGLGLALLLIALAVTIRRARRQKQQHQQGTR